MLTPERRGNQLPFPSDCEDGSEYVKVCREYYDLWLTILDKKIPREEILVVVNNFFDELENGSKKWFEGIDPRYKKPRAALVKEKANQDWSRVNEGTRNKAPSHYYPSDTRRS